MSEPTPRYCTNCKWVQGKDVSPPADWWCTNPKVVTVNPVDGSGATVCGANCKRLRGGIAHCAFDGLWFEERTDG